MRFTLTDIQAVTGGRLVGADVVIDATSIDSRELAPGSLFVPIVAERDGHDFLTAARDAGASAHLTQGPLVGLPAVEVADTSEALTAIGAEARARVDGPVIGVTGSVGKTTTKDLLAAALGRCGVTHASHRSFNNELGVPLTLANAPDDAAFVVIEMGARGMGHVAALCAVARPTIGVVLAVGAAHTEMFGDLDGVARAKGELVEALPAAGTAVLNAADPRVAAMADRTAADVVTFGAGGDVRATDVVLDDALRARFSVETPWGRAEVALGSAGLHTVSNALAAVAAAMAAGGTLDLVVEGLADVTVSPWRMEVGHTASGALVINDSYNANPMSMHAAIDALVHVAADRRIAVVGVMAELGDDRAEQHAAIGDRLAQHGVEVISVGVPEYGGTLVADAAEAVARLTDLGQHTAVLVKGSRVAALERVAAALVTDG